MHRDTACNNCQIYCHSDAQVEVRRALDTHAVSGPPARVERHLADPYCTKHPLVSLLWTNPGGCAHEDARWRKQLAVLETPLYPYPGTLWHMRACSSGVSSSRQAAGSAHCRSKARGGATPGGTRPKAAQATRLAHAPVASSPAVSSRAGHGSRRPCCQTGPWQCGGCRGLGKQRSWQEGYGCKEPPRNHAEWTPCGQMNVSQAGELHGDCSVQACRLCSPFLAKVCGCQGPLKKVANQVSKAVQVASGEYC